MQWKSSLFFGVEVFGWSSWVPNILIKHFGHWKICAVDTGRCRCCPSLSMHSVIYFTHMWPIIIIIIINSIISLLFVHIWRSHSHTHTRSIHLSYELTLLLSRSDAQYTRHEMKSENLLNGMNTQLVKFIMHKCFCSWWYTLAHSTCLLFGEWNVNAKWVNSFEFHVCARTAYFNVGEINISMRFGFFFSGPAKITIFIYYEAVCVCVMGIFAYCEIHSTLMIRIFFFRIRDHPQWYLSPHLSEKH